MWAKQEYFNDQDKLKLSNQIVSNRPNFNDEILPIQKKEAKIISITSVKNKKLIDEFYKAVDEGTKHLED